MKMNYCVMCLFQVKANVTEESEKLVEVIGEDSYAVIRASGFRPGWDLFAPWKVSWICIANLDRMSITNFLGLKMISFRVTSY